MLAKLWAFERRHLNSVVCIHECHSIKCTLYNYVYSGNDGSLNNNNGLSTVVQYNPLHNDENFVLFDNRLRRVCALGGVIEAQYRTVRPLMGCSVYRPPRRGKYIYRIWREFFVVLNFHNQALKAYFHYQALKAYFRGHIFVVGL